MCSGDYTRFDHFQIINRLSKSRLRCYLSTFESGYKFTQSKMPAHKRARSAAQEFRTCFSP